MIKLDTIKTARKLADMTCDRKDRARWEHEFLLLLDFLV